MSDPQTGSGKSTDTPAKLSGAAMWVAIFAVAVWVTFAVVLLSRVGRTETEWTRLTLVFSSIQGVAFAAAGALFGTAVQQQNVTSAKQEAARAKADANEQREVATRGRALAATMQAEGPTPSAGDSEGLQRLGPSQAATADSAEAVRKRHAQLSRSLFGNVLD